MTMTPNRRYEISIWLHSIRIIRLDTSEIRSPEKLAPVLEILLERFPAALGYEIECRLLTTFEHTIEIRPAEWLAQLQAGLEDLKGTFK